MAAEDDQTGPSDDLRLPWESDEMWRLRKAFLIAHWDEFPMARLLCLSQVFINREFLGCSYPEPVMKQVSELSEGIMDDYRDRRKQIVAVTFVKEGAGGGPGDTDAESGVKSEFDSKDKKSLKRSFDSKNVEPQQPASKAMFVDLTEDDSVDDPAGLGSIQASEDPELKPKIKTLVVARAELTIAPNRHNHVERLNWIANRAHCDWTVGFDAKIGAEKRECWVILTDVLICRMCFIGSEEDAKVLICEKAAEILLAKCHEIRRALGDEFVRAKFALFTCNDKRYDHWLSPVESLFAMHETKFKQVRSLLQDCDCYAESESVEILQKCCDKAKVPMRLERQIMKEGEQQLFSVNIAGALVHKEMVEVPPGETVKDVRARVASNVIARLLMPFLAIFEDPNTEKIRLYPSTKPVSDADIRRSIWEEEDAMMARGEAVMPRVKDTIPASPYQYQEHKLCQIKEELRNILAHRSGVERITIACGRVHTHWDFQYKSMIGVVKITDVEVARVNAGPMKAAKEQACWLASERLMNEKIIVGRMQKERNLRLLDPHEAIQAAKVNKDTDPIRRVLNNHLQSVKNSGSIVSSENGTTLSPRDGGGCTSSSANTPPNIIIDYSGILIKLKQMRNFVDTLPGGTNVISQLDMGAAKLKFKLENQFVDVPFAAQGHFTCHVRLEGVLIGRGSATGKKNTKTRSATEAVRRLMNPHMYIIEGPHGPELVSSMHNIGYEEARSWLEHETGIPCFIPVSLTEASTSGGIDDTAVITLDDDVDVEDGDVAKKVEYVEICVDDDENDVIVEMTTKDVNSRKAITCDVIANGENDIKPDVEETILDQSLPHSENGELLISTIKAESDDEHKNSNNVNTLSLAELLTNPSVDVTTYPLDMENMVALSQLVLMHRDTPIDAQSAKSILHSSVTTCKMTLDYEEFSITLKDGVYHRCIVRIDNIVFAQVDGPSKVESKSYAALAAVNRLKDVVYSIITKSTIDKTQTEVSSTSIVGDLQASLTAGNNQLNRSNIGNKLMRKMGWSGGGIGKDGQGIAEPVKVVDVFKREGLGLSAETGVTKPFKSAIHNILTEYMSSNAEEDLVFSSNFSKEQRAFIHRVCSKMHLKSVSYNQGEERQLTVQRKRSPVQLLRMLLERGGENGKYRVEYPKLLQPTLLQLQHEDE